MKRAKHIHMTERQFRAMKREHADALVRAAHQMNVAAAYIPRAALDEVNGINVRVRNLRRLLSVGGWQ